MTRYFKYGLALACVACGRTADSLPAADEAVSRTGAVELSAPPTGLVAPPPVAPPLVQSASAASQVRVLLPGLHVTFSDSTVTPDRNPFGILRFGYVSNQASWPYGSGLAVTDSLGVTVLWVYLHHGDFGPREVHQVDFDGDRRVDLFFYAGFEDVFHTYVYLNRVASTAFAMSHFALGYENRASYTPVGDFDGDGLPELLVPEAQGNGDEGPPFCGSGAEHPDVAEAMLEEYERVMAPFDVLNFKYGTASYRSINMFLTDSVRIVALHGDRRDVTTRHRNHLEWRVQTLGNLLRLADAECLSAYRPIQSYLRQRLGG